MLCCQNVETLTLDFFYVSTKTNSNNNRNKICTAQDQLFMSRGQRDTGMQWKTLYVHIASSCSPQPDTNQNCKIWGWCITQSACLLPI